MESDDDVLLSSSPIGSSPPPDRRRKLKRLRKAIRDSLDRHIERSEINQFPADEIFDILKFGDSEEQILTGSRSEEFNGGNALDAGFSDIADDEDGSGAKRALNFDSLAGDFDKDTGDRRKDIEEEIGDRSKETDELANLTIKDEETADRGKEIEDEIVNVAMDEKQLSPNWLKDEIDKKKKKKRKQRIDGDGQFDEKRKETASDRRRSEKERREYVKQLHVESQRLLRETRDATFKPVPLVQKPISSVLEKIRLRKLQISKKSASIRRLRFIDEDDEFSREVSVNQDIDSAGANERKDIRVPESLDKDTIACPIEGHGQVNRLSKDESNDSVARSCEEVFPMSIDEESKQEFRAPNGDTQDLFSDSQTSDSKNETPSSPLEEVLAPSAFPLKLQLDSEPPDDVSSEEEDYDKENIDPRSHRSVELSLSPPGDPVKAFVDDEAEEEDDSDNDLLRFKENEDDEDDDDFEELQDMIAAGYEEKPSDNEKRNELHQKWLEQQDADGTENLLQKLKYGSKVREPTLVEEEEEDQEGEEDDEFGDEAADELAPSNAVKMNLRKVKQMMPQMFTDNDDGYLSSDDEETEKKLAKQCLLEKTEERVSLFSPAEDESSREVFGRIKKLNIVPDTKKRGKTQTYFDMSLMGVNTSISTKPSFLGRGSSGCLLSSKKQGSTAVRSFIFEREDSNSKESVSVESSETIQRENRPRTTCAKFISSQTRTLTQNSVTLMNSGTSLLDILKRNSFTSKRCSVDNVVVQTESILSSFKLAKKPVKSKEDGNF